MRRHSLLFGTGAVLALLSSSTAALAATTAPTPESAITKSATAIVGGKRIETFKYVVAKNPASQKQTSWIPAMNVQDILSSAGITTHWVPGVNQLVLDMPSGWEMPKTLHALKYRSSLTNQFDIILNATSVAYAPTLTIKDVPGEVCIPIDELTSILKQLGISSTWRPGTWTLTGKVTTQKARSIGTGNITFTKLTLSNQTNTPGQPSSLPVPAPSPVVITLPVNSAFKTSSTPFGMAPNTVPGEGYLQTGKTEYVTTGSVQSAEQWMTQAFAKMGYKQSGKMSTGDYKTGYYAEALDFVPKTEPMTKQLEVEVSFRTTKANQTLMEYFVTDVVLPPRPASSMIAGKVESIAVSMTKNGKAEAGSTITNTASILGIVKAINALHLISAAGPNPGGPMISETEGATMVFHMADGQSVTVKANMQNHDQIFGAVTVGTIPLQDGKGTVWLALESAISH